MDLLKEKVKKIVFGWSEMKRLKIVVLGLVLLSFASVNNLYAEEQKVTGSASLGVFNRYIFRGYEFGAHSVVIQPAITISYRGLSVGFWSNIDSDEHPTQSFVPDRKGYKSFNETDLTLSYTYAIGKLSLIGGYIYYGTKYAQETEEVFFSASYDVITKPIITVYRDITSYPGTYINLSLSHSEKIYKEITFDLGASAGYFAGDDDYYWKTDGGTGDNYEAFHDGMVKVGVTIPVAKNFSVQPIAQYWFPLSEKARRHRYNPNGHLDETFAYGINLAFNF